MREEVADELRAAGLRVDVDDSSERMNKKIRNAQLQKIPYMLVVGDKEAEEGTVAVRTRNNDESWRACRWPNLLSAGDYLDHYQSIGVMSGFSNKMSVFSNQQGRSHERSFLWLK